VLNTSLHLAQLHFHALHVAQPRCTTIREVYLLQTSGTIKNESHQSLYLPRQLHGKFRRARRQYLWILVRSLWQLQRTCSVIARNFSCLIFYQGDQLPCTCARWFHALLFF
jgi:hypothetical protein